MSFPPADLDASGAGNLRSAAPAALRRFPAWAAHLLTASGGGLGFVALCAAADSHFGACFGWLGVALLVDGVDGLIARRLRVADRLPSVDGALLDLVVDYLTYVITPLFALWRAQAPAGAVATLVFGCLAATASALYFADARMKTPDHWFRGFPACWNVLVFYIFAFHLPLWLVLLVVLAGGFLLFAPIANVHPLRTVWLRAATLLVLLAWMICAAIMIGRDFRPDPLAQAGLLLAAVYFIALSAVRSRAGVRTARADLFNETSEAGRRDG